VKGFSNNKVQGAYIIKFLLIHMLKFKRGNCLGIRDSHRGIDISCTNKGIYNSLFDFLRKATGMIVDSVSAEGKGLAASLLLHLCATKTIDICLKLIKIGSLVSGRVRIKKVSFILGVGV
jgi:hypothetical protein